MPSFNLPGDDLRDFKRKHDGVETQRKSKKQQGIVDDVSKAVHPDEAIKTRRPIIKRLLKNFDHKRTRENVSAHNRYIEIGDNDNIDDDTVLDDVNSTIDDRIDEHSNVVIQETAYELQDDTEEPPPPASYLTKDNERTDLQPTNHLTYVDANLFDGIYEDIYEVTLPNTLWGIHRDPNRAFIVFSYFDGKTCSMSKLIHLDNGININTHIYIKGKLVNKYVANLSIEYLTNLVSQVDEYRICDKFDVHSKCEVVAVERDLCTVCQSLSL